ncbi:TPA: hypothetical protein EYP44_01480 [Candidatus Bathyarchaeota archaeon]|nr:hypothetical protein [Candidatus Bathyarchaeota archaeon]
MKFKYETNSEIVRLLRDFNDIVNHCIQKLQELKMMSVSALHRATYQGLKERYDYNTQYFVSAYRVTKSVLRTSKRRKRMPVVKKLFIRFSPLLTKFDGEMLRISVRPRKFLHISLVIGEYQRKFVDTWKEGRLRIGMITINESYVIIPLKREIERKRPDGAIAFDVNEGGWSVLIIREGSRPSIFQRQSDSTTATLRDEGGYRKS